LIQHATKETSMNINLANDICVDCGTPTFDGMPHGTGHDLSTEAQACTAAARLAASQ
jgi:hypothetical protein